MKRRILHVLLGVVLLGGAGAAARAAADDNPAPKKEAEKRSGTVTGVLTAKGTNYIEVKADGEEKARRHLYHRGGTKELRQAITDTHLGSRVRLEWQFLEHLRVMSWEVLKRAEKGG